MKTQLNSKLPSSLHSIHFILFVIVFSYFSTVNSTRLNKIIPKVVQQFYQTRVIDEFVLRGNAAILKCNLPSFVADFVYVEAWIADDGTEILPNNDDFGMNHVENDDNCSH